MENPESEKQERKNKFFGKAAWLFFRRFKPFIMQACGWAARDSDSGLGDYDNKKTDFPHKMRPRQSDKSTNQQRHVVGSTTLFEQRPPLRHT